MADTPTQASVEAVESPTQNESPPQEPSIGFAAIVYKSGGGVNKAAKVQCQAYDFRNPLYFTENEMRQLQLQHEKFVHYLSARLAMFFRMDFSLKMKGLQTISYAKYMESIDNPSHVSLFNVSGLTGVGILDIKPALGITMVARMLGGKGQAMQETRSLTEIELNLMDEVIHILLTEWCRQWTAVQSLQAQIIGHESSGRFLQVAPSDAMMIVLVMEANMGNSSQAIQLGVPYTMMEPIIKEIQAQQKKLSTMGTIEKKIQWQSAYSHIKVPVFVEWDLADLSVEEALGLRVGDTIAVSKAAADKTILKIKNIPQFTGEIGIDNKKIAFKIKDKFINN
jgi:flagellar motor switch protein FliM